MQKPLIDEPKKTDSNVLNLIKGNPLGQRNIIDIIKNEVDRRKIGASFEDFAMFLSNKLQDKYNSIVQLGNSAFLVERDKTDPKRITFTTFSMDNPSELSKNISGFYKFLKNQKVNYAETKEDLLQIIDSFKNSGLPINLSQINERKGNKMIPSYKISFGVK